jgi:hypothetical protein
MEVRQSSRAASAHCQFEVVQTETYTSFGTPADRNLRYHHYLGTPPDSTSQMMGGVPVTYLLDKRTTVFPNGDGRVKIWVSTEDSGIQYCSICTADTVRIVL